MEFSSQVQIDIALLAADPAQLPILSPRFFFNKFFFSPPRKPPPKLILYSAPHTTQSTPPLFSPPPSLPYIIQKKMSKHGQFPLRFFGPRFGTMQVPSSGSRAPRVINTHFFSALSPPGSFHRLHSAGRLTPPRSIPTKISPDPISYFPAFLINCTECRKSPTTPLPSKTRSLT